MTYISTCLQPNSIARFCLVLLCATLLASCTPHSISPLQEHKIAPKEFPENYYRQAKASGAKILNIDPVNSLVTILVRRGGSLARLGHDHVVASHDVKGYVDLSAGRADLYVQLDRLVVDEADLRSEAGFTTQPSEDAIAGTRSNMLDKVLESARFPYALIKINSKASDHSTLSISITLHDSIKTFDIPARIVTTAGGITISGELSFKQTDFGIVPFSILGGAIHVQDNLDLRFLISAVDQQGQAAPKVIP